MRSFGTQEMGEGFKRTEKQNCDPPPSRPTTPIGSQSQRDEGKLRGGWPKVRKGTSLEQGFGKRWRPPGALASAEAGVAQNSTWERRTPVGLGPLKLFHLLSLSFLAIPLQGSRMGVKGGFSYIDFNSFLRLQDVRTSKAWKAVE